MASRSNDAIVVTEIDPDTDDWRIAGANPVLEAVSGFDTNDLLGQSITMLKPDECADGWADVLTVAHEAKETKAVLAVKRKDGSTAMLEADAYPVADHLGHPRYFVLQMADRSKLNSLRANVTKLELIFGSILSILNDPVSIIDPQGRFAAINAAYTRVFGWTMDQLAGRPLSFVVGDEDREEAASHHRRSIATGVVKQERQVRVRSASGRVLKTLVVSNLVRMPSGESYRVATLTPIEDLDRGPAELAADEFDRAVRERAAARGSDSIVAGTVRVLGLDEVRAALGDQWDALGARADEIVLDVIRNHLHRDDLATPCDGGYVICFAGDDESAAEAKVRTIVDTVRLRFAACLPASAADELTFESAVATVKGDALAGGSSILAAIEAEVASRQSHMAHDARARLSAALKSATIEIVRARTDDGRPAQVAIARLSRLARVAAGQCLPHLDLDEQLAVDAQLMTFALSARELITKGDRGFDAVILAPVHVRLLESKAVLQALTNLCRALQPGVRSRLGMDIQGLSASDPGTDLAKIVGPYAALGIRFALTWHSLAPLHQELDAAGFRYACIPAPLMVADLAAGRMKTQALVASLRAQNVTIIATHTPSKSPLAALAKEGIRIFVPALPEEVAEAKPEHLAAVNR